MRILWLWLALHPALTDEERMALFSANPEPERIFYGDSKNQDPPDLAKILEKVRQDRDLSRAEKVLEDCAREHISIITWNDPDYPARLKGIYDPPPVLYCRGKLPPVDDLPVIGLVGTRKASAYGLQSAHRLGWQLAKCGAVLVSGLAAGVDAAGMTGALEANGSVIGVTASGPEQVYPKSNAVLYGRTERSGCILSEHPPGTPPLRWYFPRRNRIISGLSNGVLVVEAPEKSGALITAHLAAEQGRDVFVIPGNIDQPGFVGSNRLLRDGAIAVSSGWDILSEYEGLYPDKIRMDTGPEGQTACPEEAAAAAEAGQKTAPASAQKSRIPEKKTDPKEKSGEKIIDKEAPTAYSDVNAILAGLSSNERKIVLALQDGERLVDDVIAETGLTTGKLLACLTMLELKGIIKRLSGKRIILILNKTV